MSWVELPWVGSYQKDQGFITEDPLSEVWSRIGRFGNGEFLSDNFKPDNNRLPWDKYLRYVEVRIRQAVEFREAAQRSSLLTQPLPLYYSLLNTTRAFLALGPEVMPRPTHGLRFISAANLLDSSAQIQEGTFTDYLNAARIKWKVGENISLRDALGFIVEIDNEYRSMKDANCFVQRVSVRAGPKLGVRLSFHNYKGDFVAEWERAFPDLAGVCRLEDNNVLLVTDSKVAESADNVSEFVRTYMIPQLALSMNPLWFTFRQDNGVPKLSRIAYYYVAMFVLGMAVRYEPELMLSASAAGSELGWLLKRFLRCSERYFPQLKLMEFYRDELYFSGTGVF